MAHEGLGQLYQVREDAASLGQISCHYEKGDGHQWKGINSGKHQSGYDEQGFLSAKKQEGQSRQPQAEGTGTQRMVKKAMNKKIMVPLPARIWRRFTPSEI
jgi:hypothetical protein